MARVTIIAQRSGNKRGTDGETGIRNHAHAVTKHLSLRRTLP